MWESSNHSHPRRGFGFMDEAAEDISCNIMPELLPAPYIPLLPRVSSSLFTAHADMRYFFSHDIFFSQLGRKGSLQAVLLWPTLWVHEKRNVGIAFTNGLHECTRARQNIESEPLWQSRPFLCLWCWNMCILLMDEGNIQHGRLASNRNARKRMKLFDLNIHLRKTEVVSLEFCT